MGTSAFELLMIPIFRATLGFYLAGFTIVVVSRVLRFLFRGAYRRAERVRRWETLLCARTSGLTSNTSQTPTTRST